MLLVLGGAMTLPRAAHAQPTVPVSPSSRAAPAFHLDDAVRYAVSRNERAHISDLQVAVADAAVERARVGFLPVLTVTASDQEHAYGPPHPPNIGTGAATLNQPLLNAAAFPLYAQAKALADAQRAQNLDDKRLLAFSAASAFFAVLNADDVVQAAAAQVAMAQASLSDAQGRVDAQLTSSNDVTRAQITMAGAQREAEADAGLLENAYVQLAFVLNWPVTTGSLAKPIATLAAAQRPIPAAEQLVQFALSHRPDLVVAKHQSTAAHDFADEPLLRLVPVVGLTAQASGNTNTPPSSRFYDAFVGANATWALFDGGARYADKHSRDAQATIADLTRDQLGRSVDAQVRGSAALLKSSQSAYGEAQLAATAAAQSADETAILYQRGLAKEIERQDAIDALFVARVNLATAEFSLSQAYLALRQALGLDPLGTEYH